MTRTPLVLLLTVSLTAFVSYEFISSKAKLFRFAEGEAQCNKLSLKAPIKNYIISFEYPFWVLNDKSIAVTELNTYYRKLAEEIATQAATEEIEIRKEAGYRFIKPGHYRVECTPVTGNPKIASCFFHHWVLSTDNGIGDNWINVSNRIVKTNEELNWRDLYVANDSIKWAETIMKYVKDNYSYMIDEYHEMMETEVYYDYQKFTVSDSAIHLYIKPEVNALGEENWVEIPARTITSMLSKKAADLFIHK
jgi:hypothetical protein